VCKRNKYVTNRKKKKKKKKKKRMIFVNNLMKDFWDSGIIRD
jgi:hypothetical protein